MVAKKFIFLMRQLSTFVLVLLAILAYMHSGIAVQAAESFSTALSSMYTVGNDGVTHVTQTFTITNKTPTTFIKQYALKTSFTDIRNITVKSNGQIVPAHVVATDTGTNIAITFSDEIVGEGKQRVFSIEYDSTDLASIGGSVLEVHIPQLATEDVFDSEEVTITTPVEFGLPVRAQPKPSSANIETKTHVTKFINSSSQGISLIFGREQLYDITLRYNLENTGSSTALAQIALPPDTSYQQIFYHSLEPAPEEMKTDIDGNWIATYSVPANSITTVNALATVRLTLEPNTTVPVMQPHAIHTKSQPFWEVGDPSIQTIASSHQTPRSIYDYVIATLDYSPLELDVQPTRLGAVEALAQPNKAVCQEFADTFIAIARANSIPSRRLTGFAYTQNEKLRPLSLEGDILHAWPEYFDATQGRWIPVDPTWGDTTGGIDYFDVFDLNHIVFAINGASSSTPYPAGFYKSQAFNTKDVEVTFSTKFPQQTPSLSIAVIPNRLFGLIPIPGMYTVAVTNRSGQALYNTEISLAVSGKTRIYPDSVLNPIVANILPFQTKQQDIMVTQGILQLPQPTQLTVTILGTNGQTYAQETIEVTSGPRLIQIETSTLIIGVGLGIALFTLTTGSILVFRRRRQRFIRR